LVICEVKLYYKKKDVKMEYTVSFIGQENGMSHRLEMNRNDNIVLIRVDKTEGESMEIKKMDELFQKYDSNSKLHELMKAILPEPYPSIIVNLFRSFVVCRIQLQYTFGMDDSFEKFIIDRFKTACIHKSLIEHTGGFGKLPVMYFLKKGMDRESGVLKLYDMGLLHRIEVKIDHNEQLYNYYLPFEIPNYTNFQLLPAITTWNRIMRDMREEFSNKGYL